MRIVSAPRFGGGRRSVLVSALHGLLIAFVPFFYSVRSSRDSFVLSQTY